MKKVVEDFICINCGKENIGNGYTNHCSKCLCSLHVDLTIPGDRLSKCYGKMLPVNWSRVGDEYKVLHKCERCGHEKWNKLYNNDSIEALASIIIYPK